jgi:hypothetical protein
LEKCGPPGIFAVLREIAPDGGSGEGWLFLGVISRRPRRPRRCPDRRCPGVQVELVDSLELGGVLAAHEGSELQARIVWMGGERGLGLRRQGCGVISVPALQAVGAFGQLDSKEVGIGFV